MRIQKETVKEECTSAEFQRMAPAKVISMTAQTSSKKALGKKDKYNKLGERIARVDEAFESVEEAAKFQHKVAKALIANKITADFAIQKIAQKIGCDELRAANILEHWVQVEPTYSGTVMTSDEGLDLNFDESHRRSKQLKESALGLLDKVIEAGLIDAEQYQAFENALTAGTVDPWDKKALQDAEDLNTLEDAAEIIASYAEL